MSYHFDCEVIQGGVRCTNQASFLYVSAHTKRLVCISHAGEYRHGGKGGPAGAVAEVALLELIPAREALQARLDRAIRVVEKYRAIIDSFADAAGTISDCLNKPWWQRLFGFGECVDIALSWQKTDEKDINKKHGFPELGGDLGLEKHQVNTFGFDNALTKLEEIRHAVRDAEAHGFDAGSIIRLLEAERKGPTAIK